jgi:solute carrier family 13 (sodium-dependent dicarboxylate transporter), member 2/3/5
MGITPDRSNNLSKFFIIMIPLTASAGGFGTMLGGGRNPIAVEILYDMTGIHIGFLEWIVIQFPMVIIASLATWAVCYIFMPPKVKELPIAVKTEKLQPMSKNEIGVTIIFALAFVFWSLSDLAGVHLSVVAALALVAICSLRFVSFKTIIEKFAWEAWLVFGAGVSLGIAMLDTGAGKWLADLFIPMLQGTGKFATYYGLGVFGSTISSFISNSAAVALCLPIELPMAEGLGLNPAHMALMLPATTSFIMLVIGCPPSIIAYSTGYFSQIDFIRVAVPKTLILLALMAIMMMVYWPLVGF